MLINTSVGNVDFISYLCIFQTILSNKTSLGAQAIVFGFVMRQPDLFPRIKGTGNPRPCEGLMHALMLSAFIRRELQLSFKAKETTSLYIADLAEKENIA